MENVEKEEMKQPAGIKLSSKDWHYKYMHWFWGNKAPSKNNMFNLCPYFWMLVATLLLSPVILPFRFILFLLDKLIGLIDKYIADPIINSSSLKWLDTMNESQLYSIYHKPYKNSKKRKLYMRKSLGEDALGLDDYAIVMLFTKKWLLKNTKIKKFDQHGWNDDKEFQKWVNEQQESIDDEADLKAAKKERFEKMLDTFRDNAKDKTDSIKDYMLSQKHIILWTKRSVGLIISLILAGASYIAISYISWAVLYLVQETTLITLLSILKIIGASIVFGSLITGTAKLVNQANESGWKDYWYAQIFMYTIGYPVFYLLYMPGKIIFYYFIYELILKNLFFGIKSVLLGLKNGFIEFAGIFGDYFGSTKGDYCPGIEWKDEEETV